MATYTFQLATGNTGKKTIVDPMLNTERIANERARREFMENGYTHKYVTLKTYRTDLVLNQIISVHGVKFKIIAKNTSSDDKKVIVSITGVRYEQ